MDGFLFRVDGFDERFTDRDGWRTDALIKGVNGQHQRTGQLTRKFVSEAARLNDKPQLPTGMRKTIVDTCMFVERHLGAVEGALSPKRTRSPLAALEVEE